ncbi:hypothetical protein [Methanosarcina sp.]|uniref:hypothetical protein n=1 Tax=Methanosarcina sp. TaxID=2213 RepID=UPI003BB6120D
MDKRIFVFMTLLTLLSSCGMASALKETRITTNTADQWDPSIWSNYITWTDFRNGGSDIYLQNMANKQQTRVTKGVYAQNPYVAGTKIVWNDYRNGNSDIYMYDISNKKTTRITTNTADQYDPAMYDKYIVWIDRRNGYQDVYLQDLGTKKQTKITTNAYASCPGIYGNRIVWVDSNVIYTYDLKTKKTTKVLTNVLIDYDAYSLTIHGNKILFNELYEGIVFTHMYDISTKKFIELPFTYVESPSMYSNKVVYTDWRNGNSDIYMAQI